MNKIMELVDALITASTCLGPAPAFAARIALQAEVTRLEMELVHWKESRQSAIDAGQLMKAERDMLERAIAALQEIKDGNPHNTSMDLPIYKLKELLNEQHRTNCGCTTNNLRP